MAAAKSLCALSSIPWYILTEPRFINGSVFWGNAATARLAISAALATFPVSWRGLRQQLLVRRRIAFATAILLRRQNSNFNPNWISRPGALVPLIVPKADDWTLLFGWPSWVRLNRLKNSDLN